MQMMCRFNSEMYNPCVVLCKHTFDIKRLGVADLALVLHRDLALVIS